MSRASERIVGVWPLAGFDKTLHYRVPPEWSAQLEPGQLVRAPILNRHHLAIVRELDPQPDVPLVKLKYLAELVYPWPVLTPDLLQLAEWMAAYYSASRESTLEAMIPAAARRGMGPKREKLLSAKRGIASEELQRLQKRAPKQWALYEFLSQQFRPVNKSLILQRLGVSPAACAALVERGMIIEEARAVSREAYADDLADAEVVSSSPPELNPEQRAAADALLASLAAGGFAPHLIQGVTGSGKTEVYLSALQATLNQGGSAIYLVPEVALAPQTVNRLRSRLEAETGGRTVVWHSHLSDGERLDAWMALATGEARVVVGARSAIFAPLPNLRLIVVDEEHEPAYKQDESPRYHGRDVAVYRARLCGAVCALGSATPSLESFRNAQSGKYRLSRLTKRVDDRQMPTVHIVDMRREIMKKRIPSPLSEMLLEKMFDRFEKREQTILFINRRGYSSSMLCQECGYVAQCEHCSIAMTYHKSDETLKCHLCAAERQAPVRCPGCGSPKVRWKGLGTQKVEEAVSRLMPRARVVRMDTDVMGRKNLFRQILGEFRSGKIDVLVGTQMIAKGLDFPNVTLVGLVDADITMHLPDFRSSERAFQLLVQVAGRCGRGDRAGEVVVQTFTPHADPVQFCRRAEIDDFLAGEAKAREAFGYPPYRHLLQHLFRGPSADRVAFFAEQWAKRVTENLPPGVEMRGPAPAPLERARDQYRFQLWYLTGSVLRLVNHIAAVEAEFPWPEDIIRSLDVDPVNLI
jgi:primosomal protein N' (replication factor Y) (superfamily II helicase)